MKYMIFLFMCMLTATQAQTVNNKFNKDMPDMPEFIPEIKERYYTGNDDLRISADEGFYVPSLVRFYIKDQLGLTSMKDTMVYNESGGLISKETQKLEGGIWAMTEKQTTEYDPKGRKSTFASVYFNGNAWSSYKNVYTYDDKDSLARMDGFYGTPEDLDPSYRLIYVRDSFGRKREEVTMNWNNQWVNAQKSTYEFDSLGRLAVYGWLIWRDTVWGTRIEDIYNYLPDSRINYIISNIYNFSYQIQSTTKTEYSYDNNERLQAELYYSPWDSLWVLTNKREYVRDNSGRILSQTLQTLNDTVWYNEERYTYAYDGLGNRTTEIYEIGSDTTWRNIWKSVYKFDSVNNPVHAENFGWENGSWVERNGTLDVFGVYAQLLDAEYIFIKTATVDAEDDGLQPDIFALDQNYPNPFNPETRINFSLPQSGEATLKIYDILGREVAELINGEMEKGPHSVNFNGRNLSSGVYIYRLQSGAFAESKKMALIK